MRALRGELTNRAQEQKRELHVDRNVTEAAQYITGAQRRSGKAGSRSGSVPRSARSSDLAEDTSKGPSSTWPNEGPIPEALSPPEPPLRRCITPPVEILEPSAEDTS
jgi:hypothetical protein